MSQEHRCNARDDMVGGQRARGSPRRSQVPHHKIAGGAVIKAPGSSAVVSLPSNSPTRPGGAARDVSSPATTPGAGTTPHGPDCRSAASCLDSACPMGPDCSAARNADADSQ